jgi:hypothetical protein
VPLASDIFQTPNAYDLAHRRTMIARHPLYYVNAPTEKAHQSGT